MGFAASSDVGIRLLLTTSIRSVFLCLGAENKTPCNELLNLVPVSEPWCLFLAVTDPQ